MAEVHDLVTTDASNTARFPENMAPSAVNNGARALEGLIARWEKDLNFSVVGTISASLITLTANRASLTLTGTTSNYIADFVMGFTMGGNPNTGPVRVTINAVGPISLRDNNGASLTSSFLLSGQRVMMVKDGANDYFRVLYPTPSTGLNNIVEDTTPQLGGQLDVNGKALGDGTLELLAFAETASAVNHVQITNAATGNPPLIDSAGDDANVPLRLRGKGTGKVQLGDANLQWPDADGAANQVIETDGAGALSFAAKGGPTLDTAQATTSGSSVTFTSPITAPKRITVIFNEVSDSNTVTFGVQIGDSGGIETTGYVSTANKITNTAVNGAASSTSQFTMAASAAAEKVSGQMTLTLVDSTNNTWIGSFVAKNDTTTLTLGGGSKSLSGVLTQLKFLASAVTLDNGSVNVLWE